MGSITLRAAVRRILEEDDIRKALEKFNTIAGYEGTTPTTGPLGGTVEEPEDEEVIPMQRKGQMQVGLADLRRLLNEFPNAFEIGDIVLKQNGVQWRLVDRKGDDYTIMSTTAFTYAPFDRPSKQHPWGSNVWEDSQLRMELNTVWLEKLFDKDYGIIKTSYKGLGKLFLLSEEEAGFKQTEDTFDWFRGEDEDMLDEKRQLLDLDGDEVSWWMRFPNPGYAHSVRGVHTDGSWNYHDACTGRGAVAACII